MIEDSMARGGRKRKINVERYPSGEAKREHELSPTLSKRLMMASAARMVDEHWGTVIGRYFLTGQISPSQYEAARKFGSIVEAYDRMMQGPRPPAQSVGEHIKGAEVDPFSEAGEAEVERHKAVYDMIESLRGVIGCRKLFDDTRKLCYGVGELPDNYERFLMIKTALGSLVSYWKIDVKR